MSMPIVKCITIYTDGACIGNPGPGGYGVFLLYGDHRKDLSGGYRLTTNNRMELTAAVRGLAALKEPCRIQLFSDSEYVVNAVEKGWARRWRANGWYRQNKKMAENRDLGRHSSVSAIGIKFVFSGSKGTRGMSRTSDAIGSRYRRLSYQICLKMKDMNIPLFPHSRLCCCRSAG
jgi:ribonuclease HI